MFNIFLSYETVVIKANTRQLNLEPADIARRGRVDGVSVVRDRHEEADNYPHNFYGATPNIDGNPGAGAFEIRRCQAVQVHLQ